MYNPSILEEINELDPEYIMKMLQSQRKYNKNRDETSMKQLLTYYTDCVNYFELKQQPISSYFQIKIKELMKQIKQFGTHERAEQNKQKMNKDVIRVMQEENIQQKITATLKIQQKINQKVNKIIEQQNQRLQKRILKSKRSMAKSQSMAMSFGSVTTTPPSRKNNQGSQKLLFTKQIYSDQQNSTS